MSDNPLYTTHNGVEFDSRIVRRVSEEDRATYLRKLHDMGDDARRWFGRAAEFLLVPWVGEVCSYRDPDDDIGDMQAPWHRLRPASTDDYPFADAIVTDGSACAFVIEAGTGYARRRAAERDADPVAFAQAQEAREVRFAIGYMTRQCAGKIPNPDGAYFYGLKFGLAPIVGDVTILLGPSYEHAIRPSTEADIKLAVASDRPRGGYAIHYEGVDGKAARLKERPATAQKRAPKRKAKSKKETA